MTNDDPVDLLVLEYLRATEAGEQPDVEALASRLQDEQQRVELRQLVDTATWARASFPAPFRPQLLVAGRYRLLATLGSGGFGNVWRARDERLQRDIALKLFHPLLPADETAATLARERQALAAVHHDGIVRLLDSGNHDGTPFLAMELVHGRPLDRLIARLGERAAAGWTPTRAEVLAAIDLPAVAGTVSLIEDDWHRTATQIIAEVLWALAAAHAHGIVHRDLKPANVLLRGNGRPVVLDFGLAGLAEQPGGLTERLFGTAAYIAPEQLEQQRMGKQVQTDVYQCGLLLYELLTLRRAFGDEVRATLLTAVRTGTFPRPREVRPAVPRELEDICLRALERDARRRYATADDFRADLERWLAGALPHASRLGQVGRTLRGGRTMARRHPALLGAAAALLLGVAGTVLALPRPVAAVLLRVDGRTVAVRAEARCVLTIWTSTAESISPLQGVGSSQRSYVALLEPGVHEFKVDRGVGAGPGAPTVRLKVEAADAPVAAWQSFCEDLRRQERNAGRALRRAEIEATLDDHRLAGRGSAGLGDVSLADLFAG